MRRRLTGGEIHARAQNDIVHLALPTSLIEATPGSRYFLFSELNATSQSNLRGGLLECAEYLGPELLLRMPAPLGHCRQQPPKLCFVSRDALPRTRPRPVCAAEPTIGSMTDGTRIRRTPQQQEEMAGGWRSVQGRCS